MNDTVRTRLALSKAALQMTKGAPAFGVGIGRYYELSGEFAPQVFREMSTGTTRENAHNNFLQVLAEEGIAGLLALLLALGAALAPQSEPRWWRATAAGDG